MKRGQETNHIRKQEAEDTRHTRHTQDTHDRGLTLTFCMRNIHFCHLTEGLEMHMLD